MCGFCDYKGPDCCHISTRAARCSRLQVMQERNLAEGRPLNFIPQKEVVWPMRKVVIRFQDGTYWQHYQKATTNINEAWTFNREQGAQQTIESNTHEDDGNIMHQPLTIVPVLVHRGRNVTEIQ